MIIIRKILLSLLVLSVIVVVGNAQQNKVLIIGIDGCRPDALMAANTPHIDGLLSNASYSLDAWNEGTTSSGPSWSSMLTGVWQNKHGVNDNSFEGKNYEDYPHFFKYVEDFNSAIHTASICQWNPVNDQIAAQHADYVKNVSNENELIAETVNYLENNNPDALFLHFDDVDGAGHAHGYGPHIVAYLSAIEEVDAGIGQILNALQNRENYSNENWLIIVSTDHGGIGFGHGGGSKEERNIFLICSGDEIPNEEIKKDSVLTTVAPPVNCLLDSVELYFDGSSKVTTPLNQVFNFGEEQDFTVECRVRTTMAADVAIVTDKDWDTGRNKGFVFSFSNNTWKVNIGDGTNRKDINGNQIHDNEWHTLSATVDRNGQLIIYEDGVAADSTSMSGIGSIYSGFPISFGADANNRYAYRGSIAEVRIFNTVLSKEEINNWSCKVIDSTHAEIDSLIGYWRLSEGNNSDSIVDYSSTEAHGTISGAEWKNTIDTIEVWQYNYDDTPRITDVAVSALEHLCIPIKSEWNLDGNAVGAKCLSTGLNVLPGKRNSSIKVYPNPARESVVFDLNSEVQNNTRIHIFDGKGQLLNSKILSRQTQTYDCSKLKNGFYFYQIVADNSTIHSGRIAVIKE